MLLKNVRWIGGPPDSGKTSIASAIAARRRLPVYHYDRADLRHHKRLAESSPRYAAFLEATLDERWLDTAPDELAARSAQAFVDRFPFVLEDLTALTLPDDMPILAEGFGLTPSLVAPLLTHPAHAVFLMPTDSFKTASMKRRQKGQFGGEVSDPDRAFHNLLDRDRILAAGIRDEARAQGFTVIEVDGSETIEALAIRLAERFGMS